MSDPSEARVDLVEVRKRHEALCLVPNAYSTCVQCEHSWPCDAIRLADELEREREYAYQCEASVITADDNLENIASELEQGQKEIERLREALGGIAQQKTSDEHDENQRDQADFEFGHDYCVRVARAAIAGEATGGRDE